MSDEKKNPAEYSYHGLVKYTNMHELKLDECSQQLPRFTRSEMERDGESINFSVVSMSNYKPMN